MLGEWLTQGVREDFSVEVTIEQRGSCLGQSGDLDWWMGSGGGGGVHLS